jgi:hypothetical protein
MAITLLAHFVSLGSEVNALPADLAGHGSRILGVAVPLPGLDRVCSPSQIPTRPRPVLNSLQETEIDEEDSDSVKKPFALSQFVFAFALHPGDLPPLVSNSHRVLPGPMTASSVLRC